MFSVCDEDGVMGCASAEVYGGAALLRSVAVATNSRGKGVARLLVQRTIGRLEERKVAAIALLTTDAEGYFQQFGFRPISREHLPPELQASTELKGACPASAVAMVLAAGRM
jgi:amino-acid N-acetyltransferase